jgi:hypothetical protein
MRYSVFKEGRAMKISITAGKIVQIVSMSCPSFRYLFVNLAIMIDIIT